MLLKAKDTLIVSALALGLFTYGCADDEEPQDVVEPSGMEEPIPPPEPPMEEPAPAFNPETVYFAFDDYTLNMDAQQRLQDLSEHLRSNSNAVVQVEGHCDERGSIEYNLALGERRAQSVRNYLVQLGVDPARLSTISYGEEKPSMDGHDEGAWSKNRRAEFVITNN
jgi:peptidoglycan-associated lipoprotein